MLSLEKTNYIKNEKPFKEYNNPSETIHLMRTI